MRCVVKKEDLHDPLSRVEKVTGKNHSLPVLSCVLLSVSDDTLSITATNLEIGMLYTVPIKNAEHGTVAVPGSILLQVVGTAQPGASLTLSINKQHLVIESTGSVSKIATLDHADFPALPQVQDGSTITLPTQALKDSLDYVVFCASNSTIKPELSSVFVHPEGSHLTAAATDSFRLAEKRVPLKKQVSSDPFLIPARVVPELYRTLDVSGDEVTLSMNNHQLSITTKNVFLTLRLVSGVFPDYEQIIPKEFVTEITILRSDFERALRRANVFSDQFNQTTIEVHPKRKLCTIYSKNNSVGEMSDELHGAITGNDISISFNQRYLLDALQMIHTDSIVLQFAGTAQPALIRPIGDETYNYLVMPMNR